MKIIYVLLGFLFLALGILGIFLPILPTVPFLLLTVFFFTKGSTRLDQWFKSTQLYHRYLKPYQEQKALSKKVKVRILTMSTTMLILGFIFTPVWWAKILIILVLVLKYYVFLFRIKTLAEPTSNSALPTTK